MTLKEKLQILNKEWNSLVNKIKAKLQQKDQTITNTQQQVNNSNNALVEANKKLETVTKENSENEKVLDTLLKEFKELATQLN